MPAAFRQRSSSWRLPEPFSRFASVTPGRARSSTARIVFGLPRATTKPSSQTAKANTATLRLGKAAPMAARFGSPPPSSFTCPAAIYAAELDGASLEQVARADEVGPCGAAGWGRRRIELEEIFDARFQRVGEAQRDGGVGQVVARLDGVDGLAAHARGARQSGGGHAAFAAERGEAGMDTRIGRRGIVSFRWHCRLYDTTAGRGLRRSWLGKAACPHECGHGRQECLRHAW